MAREYCQNAIQCLNLPVIKRQQLTTIADREVITNITIFIPVLNTIYVIRGANQKVFFSRSSPIWHMRSSTYLSYLLINDICLFKLFCFKSIDINVPRKPIVAESHFSVNAGNLDKHWNYPNFLHASYHYRNIVPHIHVHFYHKM